MNARKLIASTCAALTVAGGLTLAYAQEAPNNPPTAATQGPGTSTGSNNTLSNANTPSVAPMAPSAGTTMTPGSDTLGATTTERPMQADRN